MQISSSNGSLILRKFTNTGTGTRTEIHLTKVMFLRNKLVFINKSIFSDNERVCSNTIRPTISRLYFNEQMPKRPLKSICVTYGWVFDSRQHQYYCYHTIHSRGIVSATQETLIEHFTNMFTNVYLLRENVTNVSTRTGIRAVISFRVSISVGVNQLNLFCHP